MFDRELVPLIILLIFMSTFVFHTTFVLVTGIDIIQLETPDYFEMGLL